MKKNYNVSYDLNKAGKDYAGLYAALKTYDYFHLLDSTWLLYTVESAAQIWSKLSPYIDKDDSILIAEITSNNSGWLSKQAWTWINQRVQKTV